MHDDASHNSMPASAQQVVAKYQRLGYVCNDITGRSALVEERIGIKSQVETDRVVLCSKKEPGLLNAKRLNAVLIVGSDGALKHVGTYTDSIHM